MTASNPVLNRRLYRIGRTAMSDADDFMSMAAQFVRAVAVVAPWIKNAARWQQLGRLLVVLLVQNIQTIRFQSCEILRKY